MHTELCCQAHEPAHPGIVTIMDDLVRTMNAAASPENARALTRYFKVSPGSYGEGDICIGLKLGELRQLARPYLSSSFDADQWLPMLRSPIHEHRMITLIVMSERAKKLIKRDDDDELRLIYDTYLDNTGYVNNWDLVDVSCGSIVGVTCSIATGRRSTRWLARTCCGTAGLRWLRVNASWLAVKRTTSTN